MNRSLSRRAIARCCLIASLIAVLFLPLLVAGCSDQQVATGLVTAERVDALLTARAQAAVDAMPPGAQRDAAQAKVNEAATNRQLYLLLAEIAAPVIVKAPTTSTNQ